MKKILLFSLIAGCSLPLWAADLQCEGSIKNRTIYSNIQVKKNCSLEKVTVTGNVLLENQASLHLNQVTIKGNLESHDTFNHVSAKSSRFNGNIQLENGHRVDLINNLILGNLALENNKAQIQVSQNTIQGNMTCSNNLQNPQGQQNEILGNKAEQCSSL